MRLKKILAISISIAMLLSFVMIMPVSAANNRIDLSVDEVVFVQGMTPVTVEIRQSEEVPNIIGGHPLRIWLNDGAYSMETPPVPLTISAVAESSRLNSMGGNELGGAPNRTWWQSNATGGTVAEGTLLATLTIGSSAVITEIVDDYTLYIREWMGGAAATPADAVKLSIRLLPYATVTALNAGIFTIREGVDANVNLLPTSVELTTNVPGVTATADVTWVIDGYAVTTAVAGQSFTATATLSNIVSESGAVVNSGGAVTATVEITHAFILGDINGDGFVDGEDLDIMIDLVFYADLGIPRPTLDARATLAADINGDGFIDGEDLDMLIDAVFYLALGIPRPGWLLPL